MNSFKDSNNLIISSTNPCLLIYMLDESESMGDKFGNSNNTKAQELCNAINNVIFDLGLKCMKNGEIRNRFEVAMFSYGNKNITSGWKGNLKGKFLHTISNIFMNVLDDSQDKPIWITPNASGGTPMKAAFENVKLLCDDWIKWGRHKQDCHPPIIINVTDGEATDDDSNFTGIRKAVKCIQDLYTDYGHCIVLNVHISGRTSDKVIFPENQMSTDIIEKLLFEISTPLTPMMIHRARNLGYNLSDNAKGYVFNGDGNDLINFLNVGSDVFDRVNDRNIER